MVIEGHNVIYKHLVARNRIVLPPQHLKLDHIN